MAGADRKDSTVTPETPVLVVPFDTDPQVVDELLPLLKELAYDPHLAHGIADVWGRLPLIVVTVGGGNESMQQFIRQHSAVPGQGTRVLALVCDLSETQESALLEAGARDVLPFPTTSGRLRARLAAVTRGMATVGADVPEVLRRGALAIHLGRREVRIRDEEVPLTKTEFDLLASLADRPRHVVTRMELTATASGRDHMGARALESHLSRMRRKIEQAGGPRLAEPVRGVGYRLGTY